MRDWWTGEGAGIVGQHKGNKVEGIMPACQLLCVPAVIFLCGQWLLLLDPCPVFMQYTM